MKLPPTGAVIAYDYQMGKDGRVLRDAQHPCPRWVRGLFGDDIFVDVAEISYPRPGTIVTDQKVALLSGLTSLKRLYLGPSQVTDASVPHLETLTGLKELQIHGTQISPAGIQRLKRKLPQCKIIR